MENEDDDPVSRFPREVPSSGDVDLEPEETPEETPEEAPEETEEADGEEEEEEAASPEGYRWSLESWSTIDSSTGGDREEPEEENTADEGEKKSGDRYFTEIRLLFPLEFTE